MTGISASPEPSRGTQGIRVLGLLRVCGRQVLKPLLNWSGNSRWVPGLASEVSALLGGSPWEDSGKEIVGQAASSSLCWQVTSGNHFSEKRAVDTKFCPWVDSVRDIQSLVTLSTLSLFALDVGCFLTVPIGIAF